MEREEFANEKYFETNCILSFIGNFNKQNGIRITYAALKGIICIDHSLFRETGFLLLSFLPKEIRKKISHISGNLQNIQKDVFEMNITKVKPKFRNI